MIRILSLFLCLMAWPAMAQETPVVTEGKIDMPSEADLEAQMIAPVDDSDVAGGDEKIPAGDAADSEQEKEALAELTPQQVQMKVELEKLAQPENAAPTLLFNPDVYQRITNEIHNQKTHQKNKKDPDGEGADEPVGPPPVRDLTLKGILLVPGRDWVVWINEFQITAKRRPPEMTDIKVYKNYVEIKWLDAVTNTTHAVRLRPQQRYNMDAKRFYPG